MSRIDGPDELLAAVVAKAVDDLAYNRGRHAYSAAVFLDEAGLLETVCTARGLCYDRAVNVLLEGGPRPTGKRR